MQHFFDWIGRDRKSERPWLILGKGPTFALRDRFDLRAYHLLSLNHAVREQPVLLAHMIDLDVVDACGEMLLRQAGHVVLPWYPHVKNAPGTRSLEELVPDHQLLRRLATEGRLLWYDLSTGPRRHGPGPVVHATYFSAEAAVGLLALAGVRRVRSLGVDGGASYSADFEDLTRKTLLANARTSFDLQFQGIARTMLRTGVDFAPLDRPSPIVIGVPSSPASVLPDRVLEYSVRKHTSISVRMHFIRSADDIESMTAAVEDVPDQANPAGCRQAIMLHSGALVLDDLRKLWGQPLEREIVEVPRSFRASKPPLAPAIAVVSATDAKRLGAMSGAVLASAGQESAFHHIATLPDSWSRRDRFERGKTSLLLYATPELRPWISWAHPFGHLWVAALLEAVREGFVSLDLVRKEVRLGHVRPSLLEQVERDSPEGMLLPWSARRRDAGFRPPGGPPGGGTGLLPDALLVLRALARQARRQVSAYRHRQTTSRA